MTIVITLPYFFDGEAGHIVRLLQSGVDLVHIRKPEASSEDTERLISEIPAEFRNRLVLHDHYVLAQRYSLYGVHLNSRNAEPPEGWAGSVSRSCHTLEEVARCKAVCNYVSLSPVFDSISKKGYRAAFTAQKLARAKADGIIDGKVLALGGVTFSRIDEVLAMGFGGAMILGDAWKTVDGAGKGFSNSADAMPNLRPVALSVAGSDSSAGAGIQQDMKTMMSVGVYCATAITAITSQNTLGVHGVMPVPASVVGKQVEAVLADMNVTAVKIGMMPDAEIAKSVANILNPYRKRSRCRIVYDPVMVSTSGRRLMAEEAVSVIKRELLPICTLVTPNIPEASCLLGHAYKGKADGLALAGRYNVPFLVKGGHGDDAAVAVDMLFMPDGTVQEFASERIASHNLHGTGCTLSSAIAAFLVKDNSLPQSVSLAKQLLSQAIAMGKDARIGRGNGPLMFEGLL